MRDSKIVTLYKNKGERSDCNNYRGISLLSVVGKVYAKVILTRLHGLAEHVYPESQCGFRANRSTIDMIFSLPFDMVSRDGLFKILPKIGCPPKLQSLIESFHTNMKGTVQYNKAVFWPLRYLLFADDAGLAAHTEQGLQSLMDRFSQACRDFSLIISLKKTEVMGQNVEVPPVITIGDYQLKVVNHFTYLGSTASSNLPLDKEIG
ncbi:hypothetical protein Bbelb_038320 [Branchiostoma belcheri]|nr:hypothetical protein Bbelb_038320 [Branchiostoma belcheri]